jgi:hypothetical protein
MPPGSETRPHATRKIQKLHQKKVIGLTLNNKHSIKKLLKIKSLTRHNSEMFWEEYM